MTRLRSALYYLGLVALGGWVLLLAYIRVTDGWGVFAVAPALLPLLGASAVVLAVGAPLWILRARRGTWDPPLLLTLAAHGAILVYASSR
jgi:hypothetical protein